MHPVCTLTRNCGYFPNAFKAGQEIASLKLDPEAAHTKDSSDAVYCRAASDEARRIAANIAKLPEAAAEALGP